MGRPAPAESAEAEPSWPHRLCPYLPRGGAWALAAGIALEGRTATLKALAEAVERRWLSTPPDLPHRWSWEERPEEAADPALWLDVRRRKAVRALRRASLRWIRGRDLLRDRPLWLPAQAAFVPYRFDDEPRARRPMSTGAAFGRSVAEAALRGLLECIERDAFMIAHLKRLSLPRVSHPRIRELQARVRSCGRSLHVFEMAGDFGVATHLALQIDATGEGPAVCAGLKAGLDPVESAIGAALESQSVRHYLKQLLRSRAPAAVRRRSQVVDEATRAAFWRPPGSVRHLDYLLGGSETRRLADRAPRPALEDILRSMGERGHRLFLAVLGRIRSAGVVVKVLAPDLQPLQRVEDRGEFISRRLEGKGASRLNRVPNPLE